jgi:hypothetical protein
MNGTFAAAGRLLTAGLLTLLLAACGGDESAAEPSATAVPSLAEIVSGDTAWLDGSDSRGERLRYAWTQSAGPEVALDGADTAIAHFTAPPVEAGTVLRFSLQVTDAAGLTASAELQLSVVPPMPMPLPTLADVCALLGSAASPLCSAVDGVSGSLAGVCSRFAPAGFCSLFGGNLHALVAGCDAAAPEQAAALCKLVDQVLLGAASVCRQLTAPTSVCALMSGLRIGEEEIASFEAGPLARALQLQRELGVSLPLRDAEFLSTHNSFNATTNNFPITASGADSNQKYSIPDQLRIGVRGIELDIHWWFSLEGSPASQGRAPVLCHGNVNHLGCTTERSLRAGLIELRDWLLAHPGEVIVIDLEDNMNEAIDDRLLAHQTAGAVLDEVVGELLYKPATLGRRCEDGFPVELSTAEIRAAGKQIIIYSSCGVGETWPQQVWERKLHSQNSISGLGDAGIRFPDQCVFAADQYRDHWTRIYEDATLVGLLTGAARQINADEVREMMRCGVNMPSLDQIAPGDPRVAAFVWSWLPGEPADGGGDCARHRVDGRFDAVACGTALPSACVNAADAGDWRIAAAGSACAAGYRFDVPRNSPQNEALKAAKRAAGIGNLRLNYRRDAAGVWRTVN